MNLDFPFPVPWCLPRRLLDTIDYFISLLLFLLIAYTNSIAPGRVKFGPRAPGEVRLPQPILCPILSWFTLTWDEILKSSWGLSLLRLQAFRDFSKNWKLHWTFSLLRLRSAIVDRWRDAVPPGSPPYASDDLVLISSSLWHLPLNFPFRGVYHGLNADCFKVTKGL